MDKKRLCSIISIICGIISIINAIVLFVIGIKNMGEDLWFLVFFALPFAFVGFLLTFTPIAKKIIKRTKERNISLLKEYKTALMDNETAEDKTVCKHCGSENNYSNKFCKECGKPLHKICPYCQATLSEDSKFCNQCGKELK